MHRKRLFDTVLIVAGVLAIYGVWQYLRPLSMASTQVEIGVSDLVRAINAALEKPAPSPLAAGSSGAPVSWSSVCDDLVTFEELDAAMGMLAERTDGSPSVRRASWSALGIDREVAEVRYYVLGRRAAQRVASITSPRLRTSAQPCGSLAIDIDFRLTRDLLDYFESILRDAGVGIGETGITPEQFYQARVDAVREDLTLIIDLAHRLGWSRDRLKAEIQSRMRRAHAEWRLSFDVIAMSEREYRAIAIRIGITPSPLPQLISPRPEVPAGAVSFQKIPLLRSAGRVQYAA